MITFLNNQRYSQRYVTGQGFQEEVLAASGVEFDNSVSVVTSGADNVQDALALLDSSFAGLEALPASGVVDITEVVPFSGVAGGSVGRVEAVEYPSGSDGIADFSFTVFGQPTDAVTVKVAYSPLGSTSGSASFKLQYNIFESGDDLAPVTEFPFELTATSSLVSGDFETYRLFNFNIPLSEFSSAGTAPFIVSARLIRDSGTDTYGDTIAVIKIFAEGIPGAIAGSGNSGYTGGNLTVDGDLVVENTLVYEAGGVTVPTASGDAGITGTFVYDGSYLYIKTASQWVRVSVASF